MSSKGKGDHVHGFRNRSGKPHNLRTSTWFKVSTWFILATVSPLLLFAFVTFQQTRDIVYGYVGRFSEALIEELSNNVSRELSSLQNISIDIAYMSEVQQLCTSYIELSDGELKRRRDGIRVNISYKIALNRDVTDVFLYMLDGERMVLYGDERFAFSLLKEHEEALLTEALEKNGHIVMHPYTANQQVSGIRWQQDMRAGVADCIIIARAVRSLSSGEILGIMVMRVNERLFSNLLTQIDLGTEAVIIVCNERDMVVSSSDSAIFPINTTIAPPEQGSISSAGADGASLSSYDGVGQMAIESNLEGINWRILCFLPNNVLDRESLSIFQNLFILFIPIGILIVIGIWVFKRILWNPLASLADSMREAEGGNFSVTLHNDSKDEIGRATRSFNKMLEKIQQLLDDVKLRENQKRLAEMAALQAQVNPHFLSNALNIARCMAQAQQAYNIDNLLTALVDLLHISMGIHKTMLTLEEEFKYLQSYVEIYRHRSYSTFDVQYDLQPDLADSLVPKLILQPIVENALTHGLTKDVAKGQVVIRATGDKDEIHVSVTDNGRGMKPEQIADVSSRNVRDNGNRFSGIGLCNVDERIKMHFGNSYGVHLESIYHMYTTVEIVIPNLKEVDASDSDITRR